MTRRAGLLLVLLAGLANADERILSFDSELVIEASGSVLVTENITVRAEGLRIQRGIYRDFPTEYRDRFGNTVSVRFLPLTVQRDDGPENFFTRKLSNGVRTYFGSEDRLLQPGVYRYTFRYRVDRVLGYFDDFDELYWNVTGLDWAFPIDSASATVDLGPIPAESIINAAGFTGPAGATGNDFTTRRTVSGVRFETSRTLAAHEGLTVAVSWPKGFVEEPDWLTRVGWLLADNRGLLVLAAGFVLVLAYLVPMWRRFGRDPEQGVIVTRYEPPEGLPPASLRFVRQMYYDNKVMSAAVISLAVKGYLRIEESDGDFTLVDLDPSSAVPLAKSERALYESLFGEGGRLKLDDKYHARIRGAREDHRDALRREFRGRYFRTNGLLNLPAWAIAVVSTILAFAVTGGVTLALVIGVAVLFVACAVFTALMRRPTVLGRKTLDETLGFEDYLEIAEKDELNLRNPPEKTPELFERFLPYALALGVEQAWSDKFAAVLARVRDSSGQAFRPSWYSGDWSNASLRHTTSSLSSGLSSSISSSSAPPGSSSGSSGGGFSGGGGGGGGGGGW